MKCALCFMMALLTPLMAAGANRPVGQSFVSRSEVIARNGMAATSQPLAVQTALDMLKQGGTAVDAAIAANALMGLIEPTGNGVGGDLFALVWEAKAHRLHGLNASGRSPRALTRERFRELGHDRIPAAGPLPITVPGCVDGWATLHARFGRLPLATLLEPAIRYAREGFPVAEVVADEWEKNAASYAQWPGFKAVYMPAGRAPKKGEVFRNPALAATLEKIARGGRDAFYRGEVAAAIETFLQAHGGFLSRRDLAEHHSDWVEPVSTNYRGYDVWQLPPNTQGIAVLQILNLLEAYDLKAMGFGSADYLHHFVEAKKLAFEDRARFYADPAVNAIPVAQLISKEYAATRRTLLDPKKPALALEPGNPFPREGDTIYLTVADGEGNLVSLIQSNYRGMGSGMTPPELGFCFQNRGEAFTLQEGRFNTYAPGKRPFHTIIPGFVTRAGEPFLSFGVMGGAMQPQGQAQVLINLIDFGMGLQEAADAPRLQHVGSSEPSGETMTDGGTVFLEFGFPEAAERELVRRGHQVGRTAPATYGGCQAIRYDSANKVYYGASDFRKDGHAAGY